MKARIPPSPLSKAERKAMEMEIQKQLAEYDRKHANELDALILWLLHEEFGFGKKRLRRFYDRFGPALDELVGRYELDDDDKVWLCTRKLKEQGIDISQWRRENGEDL